MMIFRGCVTGCIIGITRLKLSWRERETSREDKSLLFECELQLATDSIRRPVSVRIIHNYYDFISSESSSRSETKGKMWVTKQKVKAKVLPLSLFSFVSAGLRSLRQNALIFLLVIDLLFSHHQPRLADVSFSFHSRFFHRRAHHVHKMKKLDEIHSLAAYWHALLCVRKSIFTASPFFIALCSRRLRSVLGGSCSRSMTNDVKLLWSCYSCLTCLIRRNMHHYSNFIGTISTISCDRKIPGKLFFRFCFAKLAFEMGIELLFMQIKCRNWRF